ncbi:MAG: IS66 family transposase [Victivallaceae bacterium]|nr:IS66 family transposase [Victivallaceae bacterium]
MCCECLQLQTEKGSLEQEKSCLQKDVSRLEQEVNLLHEMLKLERMRKFGSKSEQSNPDQLEFSDLLKEHDELNAVTEKESEATEHIEYDRKKKKNKNLNGRVAIPGHLERHEIILDLSPEEKICPVTGREMIKIGEDITEQLAVDPPRFYVNKYIRPKYASPDRRKGAKAGVISAALPGSPVERCKADVSTLASIIVNKYADHLPLYRQEQIFKRHGIRVPANTMCDWVNNCAGTLKPLYRAHRNVILAHDYLNVDDTPIDLLRKGKKKRQSRLWAVHTGSGPPGTFFHFTENWKNENAIKLLESFSGNLQTDGYSGYEKVGRRPDVILLGCWAHVRRKFVDAEKIGVKDAGNFVMLINLLYRIEHRIAGLPNTVSDADRLSLRQKRANRVIERFIKKINTTDALPKSALGKAITYAQNHKHILSNYLTDLRFKPDNNAVERAIRPVTLGRKNFLFVGSERGGETAAIFMSLIASCKANKINPYEYLKTTKLNGYNIKGCF